MKQKKSTLCIKHALKITWKILSCLHLSFKVDFKTNMKSYWNHFNATYNGVTFHQEMTPFQKHTYTCCLPEDPKNTK